MKQINHLQNRCLPILLFFTLLVSGMVPGGMAHGQSGKQAPVGKKVRAAQQGTAGRQESLEKELRDYLRPAVFSLTMVMVHDVVNPPAAARYYAYVLLGAYDLISRNGALLPGPSTFISSYPTINPGPEMKSGAGMSTGSEKEPVPDMKSGPGMGPGPKYDERIAALYCILETGRQLLPSGFLLKAEEDKFLLFLKKKKLPASLIGRSVAAAVEMSGRIVDWAKTDHYNQLSALRRYSPLKEEGHWYPTPPAYMEAIEPHWNTIRPMIIDSANEFSPPPLTPFSKDKTSGMYRLVMEVYDSSFHLSEEQLTMADFWDCNPFNVNTSGHMAIGLKKISPGGHWMDITGIASRKADMDLGHAIQVHALVAVTLMDAFISCWDEKYRSNRIRPETYINKYIDIKWHPRLQTPPFPEYTSGHSVISTAAAEMLTYLLGDHFSYRDNSEELFDIRPRSFGSFREAAEEAAISRFYGGIHYRDAVVAGQVEGKAVGLKIIDQVRMAGIKPYRRPE